MQVIEQLFAGEGLTGRLASRCNNLNSLGVSLIGLPLNVTLYFSVSISSPPVRMMSWRFDVTPRSAQQCAHAGDHAREGEWFGDVIIRADLQACDLIDLLREGGEHDDGYVAFTAQDAADFAPVDVGEHQVEDDEIGFFAAGSRQRGLTVGGGDDAESVFLQIISGEAGDLGFVINDEDEWGHGKSIRDKGGRNERLKVERLSFNHLVRFKHRDVLPGIFFIQITAPLSPTIQPAA